jgi:hypothetical protein
MRLDTLQVLSSEFSQHTCSKYILQESPDSTMSEESERMFTRLDALQVLSVHNISVVNTQDMCCKYTAEVPDATISGNVAQRNGTASRTGTKISNFRY